jgi:outer membrane protein OmpU
MNNFKKIGLTALAGSLVAMGSAVAGDISVTGSINTTLKFGKPKSARGDNNTTRSLGTDRDVTFSGGGELDNGTTFSVSTTTNDDLGVSASTTTISTPSLGSFSLGTSNGSVSYLYDEEVPKAYEEVSDGHETMSNQMGNFMDNNHIAYTSPTFEMMGASITAHAGYSPQASDVGASDGGTVTYSAAIGAGKELGLTIAYEGLKVGVYGAERERTTPNASTGQQITDEFNGVWYAKYSMGPLSIGYSESYMDAGVTQGLSSETTTTPKTERTAGGIFTGEQMSIAFNVNDNMSISYTTSDETYDTQDDAQTAVTTDDDVTQTIDAIQVAYSMGGMSIKAYNMEITNPDQDDNAADQSVTEIALGFAF